VSGIPPGAASDTTWGIGHGQAATTTLDSSHEIQQSISHKTVLTMFYPPCRMFFSINGDPTRMRINNNKTDKHWEVRYPKVGDTTPTRRS